MASNHAFRLSPLVGIFVGAALLGLRAQPLDKELVAVVSGPALAGGIVSSLAWDGNALIVQTAAANSDGSLTGRYFSVPGRGMEVRSLAAPPPGVAAYWTMKSSRVSPTGLGRITVWTDKKMPMYGIASQGQRISDAVDMGGMVTTHEVRIGSLVVHRRRDVEPYDGEVWSWSPAEVNRVAYVDEKGQLWVAGADGRDPTRLAKGRFTLPAWSPDGGVLAVGERSTDGTKWEIFVIHLNEKLRSPVRH
jgi:hypothetical protein